MGKGGRGCRESNFVLWKGCGRANLCDGRKDIPAREGASPGFRQHTGLPGRGHLIAGCQVGCASYLSLSSFPFLLSFCLLPQNFISLVSLSLLPSSHSLIFLFTVFLSNFSASLPSFSFLSYFLFPLLFSSGYPSFISFLSFSIQ